MRHRRQRGEAECVASSDRGGTRASSVLEATHVTARYASDTGVGLVVLGLANGCPFCSLGGAIDDELGETICNTC